MNLLYRYTVVIVIAWTLLIVASGGWNIVNERRRTFELARNEAVANFNKDYAFRLWASQHGGVYVPPDEKTPPNPYLTHIPDRDVVTTAGKHLTLMNPAYMLRQFMNEFAEFYGIRGRITSFKALNPSNRPDTWERKALTAFQNGTKEVFELTTIEDKPFLRLMRPMITTQGCLKCHGFQGYKVGDIRGGIGVSVPMAQYYAMEINGIKILALSHLAIWSIGFLLTALAFFNMKRNIRGRMRATEELSNANRLLETIFNHTHMMVAYMDRDFNFIRVNRAYALSDMREPSYFVGKNHFDLYPGTQNEEIFRTAVQKGEPQFQFAGRFGYVNHPKRAAMYWDWSLVPVKDDEGRIIGLIHTLLNVTDRINAEKALVSNEARFRSLFENSPISLWEEDFSAVKVRMDELRQSGVNDFSSYFMEHPGEINVCAGLVRVIDVNHSTLAMLKASYEEVVAPGLQLVLTDASLRVLAEELSTFAMGKPEFYSESDCETLTGERLWIVVSANIAPGYEDSWGRVFVSMIDITKRKMMEEQLNKSINEKEILIREVFHRTKNNMQVINSLVTLQAQYVEDKKLQYVFKEIKSRIFSMSLVHEMLYRSKDLSSIDIGQYIRELANTLVRNFRMHDERINVRFDVDNVPLSIEVALPCGLIINELMTNSLKYAVGDSATLEIDITLSARDNGELFLHYQDSGEGFPAGFNIDETPTLGMQLVKGLIESQLRGTVEIGTGGGASFTFRFKDNQYPRRINGVIA